MSLEVDSLPVHRPPSLQLDSARRRDSSTSPSSPFPLSSSVFESDSDFRSQSSASLLGSASPSDLPSSGLPSIAEYQGSTSSTPTKKRTASQPATVLDTPLRQARHSLSSTSTMSLPTSSPNKLSPNPLEEPTIIIPDLRSSTSSINLQLGDFVTSSSFSFNGTSLLVMKVRDFAYDLSDERHYGKGLERQGQPEPMPPSPKRDPFQTNWGFGQPVDHNADLDQASYPPYDDESDISETEFVPGWYRCLYDFVPEGPAEMAMTAGNLYHIVSRCAVVGWVIAVNEDNTTGIVPEGYVTLERRDDDFEDERILQEHDMKAEDELLETPTTTETPTSSNESMDEDEAPTPHAGDELDRPIRSPSDESQKTQLPPENAGSSEQHVNGHVAAPSEPLSSGPSDEPPSGQAPAETGSEVVKDS